MANFQDGQFQCFITNQGREPETHTEPADSNPALSWDRPDQEAPGQCVLGTIVEEEPIATYDDLVASVPITEDSFTNQKKSETLTPKISGRAEPSQSFGVNISSNNQLLSNLQGSKSLREKIRTKNASFKTPGKHAPGRMLNNQKDIILDTTEPSVYEGTLLDTAPDDKNAFISRTTKKLFSNFALQTPISMTSKEELLLIDPSFE